ncbi:Deoxyguanosinetriphosphate triphosphohydrolase [Mesorhizobium prunaredense]|uniref:Deoxyguanosinetriphosphate triphosphohydrolase n=1 Tax=Mesorhizobium prunaredense TaxID=1631249 RepID=A0A1R3VFJ3_9HYPH|nr:dNTP triphosphohydrolase [Mesorhizobium prunaredense]SIT58680.1 Deoxyguanosinetriphosphate triphosphohydrolase [Mesorhizobium prunaredense]
MVELQWGYLLNSERRKDRVKRQTPTSSQHVKAVEHRTELERDHDRILFSTPVRRMQDKTQVFPLEAHDSVRTRLTHSHEVANMARSLGTALVYAYPEKIRFPEELNAPRNIPALLEAIGLAHDLGNPPFGHQGEAAIRSWMNSKSEKDPEFFADLSAAQKADFLEFEGNAQAFRLLTRLQIVNDDFGLNMTYAFLAALMKYPSPSDRIDEKVQARKKFNFFQSEAEIAHEVWSVTGLAEGVRHPLTYIMEACDDIAYSVVDIEDAAKKGLVNFDSLIGYLEHAGADDRVVADVVMKAKDRHEEFRKESLSAAELDDITLQMWRVTTIGVMVLSATDAFVDNYDAIMSGTFEGELMGASNAVDLWKCLKKFAKTYIYTHRQVLEVELKGHQTIHGLMDIFWKAIQGRRDADSIGSKRPPLSSYVYSRISENYRRVATSDRNKMPLRYRELQLVTDMISGMTDTFAVSLLEDLSKRGAA